MPDIHTYWRMDRPAEGFYTTELPADPATQTVRTFLPEEYQPRYPYPLLVLFHGHGGNEETVLRLAPRLSRRNYLAISLRGPEALGTRRDGRPACGWGGDAEAVTDYVLRAVEQTRRTYHVHSERVFLIGLNEGAATAYRAAFALGGRVAGVAALNGITPRSAGTPLFRLDQARRMRVLIAHGTENTRTPFAEAVRDHRLFYAVGADVRLHTYPTTHRVHPDMLRDLNRWVIGQVNAEHDLLVRAAR